MGGKIIAVANMKGGVGKTTAVVGLAETLAAVKTSVLVIDADAQANASVCLVGDERLAEMIDAGRTFDAFLDDKLLSGAKAGLGDYISPNVSRVTHAGRKLSVSLLATSAGLRLLERDLIFELTKKDLGLDATLGRLFRLLAKELDDLRRQYDFVLIDCAPGISAVTEASVRLADLVVVPTIPDFLSTYGLTAFCRTLWSEDSFSLEFKPRRPPWVVASRSRPINEHKNFLAQMQVESARPEPPFSLFETVIPEAAAVAAGLKPPAEPIPFTRKWGQPIVNCFGSLTKEIVEALRVA